MPNVYTYNGNSIFKNDFSFISFYSEVKQIVDLENYIVVLVGYCSEVGERNVFCYNASGQLKWQIPNPVQLHEINYYTGIYIREQQLYAYSVSGVEYNLNEETGEILKSEFIK